MRLVLLVLLAVTWISSASAQSIGALQSDPEPARSVTATLPDPPTRAAIREVLSELDDTKVRALLIERLTQEADRRAAAVEPVDTRSLGQVAAENATALGAFFIDVVAKVPRIPHEMGRTFQTFEARRDGAPLGQFLSGLIASLALGALAGFLVRRATSGPLQWVENSEPLLLWHKVRFVVARFALQMASVIAFAITAFTINHIWNGGVPVDRDAVDRILSAVAWTWTAVLLARFMLAPHHRALRLCPMDDETASFLTWRTGAITAVFCFGFGFSTWMNDMGSPYQNAWVGAWVNLAFHVLLGQTVWQARSGIRDMLLRRDNSDDPAPIDERLGRAWPRITIGLIVLHWFIVEWVVATGNVDGGLFMAMAVTLLTVMTLPLIDSAIRAVARSFLPALADRDVTLQAADHETRIGAVRIGRVVVFVGLGFALLSLWSVDVVALAQQGVGARFAGAILDVLFIAGVAYGLWELVRIVTDRQIAIEQVALGIAPGDGQDMEGEGGGAGARLGTLLPLIRVAAQSLILILSLLAILGELGVNVLPLLAGAGVVGLAIGFGAQTLVKDIVSGIFFLIDDAFRRGEYVDIGGVKGTVEKISVRSMQLRHHNGPLNTVPFGDIRHVTNFSRDWVVMKLTLRLTYETDAEKVRKMIKKLGQELLSDPDLGPQFLQPLKSQGVVEMDDSAMLMRVKFMTRPGDQWVLRRVIYARLRDLFEVNGIRFANREVTVRLEGGGDRELSETDKEAIGAAALEVANPPR